MWTCPRCERRFASKNQTHACGRYELDTLFSRSDGWVRKVDVISPRNQVHHFRLRVSSDLTPALKARIRDAYAVGEQRHLS
jgi:hypothetical protein